MKESPASMCDCRVSQGLPSVTPLPCSSTRILGSKILTIHIALFSPIPVYIAQTSAPSTAEPVSLWPGSSGQAA